MSRTFFLFTFGKARMLRLLQLPLIEWYGGGRRTTCNYNAALTHSQKKLATPQSNTPATHTKSARRVLQSLRNVGRAFSELLIYIAFTISR